MLFPYIPLGHSGMRLLYVDYLLVFRLLHSLRHAVLVKFVVCCLSLSAFVCCLSGHMQTEPIS